MSKVMISVMLLILTAVELNGCDKAGTTFEETGATSADTRDTAYPSVTDNKVPLPVITAVSSRNQIPPEQRSYCWGKLGCADYIGGIQGMEKKPSSLVRPGEPISIIYPYREQPSIINLIRFTGSGEEIVQMNGHSFTAPHEDGIYYYEVLAFWKTEDGRYSKGDTSSAFKIEITTGVH